MILNVFVESNPQRSHLNKSIIPKRNGKKLLQLLNSMFCDYQCSANLSDSRHVDGCVERFIVDVFVENICPSVDFCVSFEMFDIERIDVSNAPDESVHGPERFNNCVINVHF